MRISGGGLPRPIVLRDPADVAAVFWGGGVGEVDRMERPSLPGELGPRYRIRFELWDEGTPPASIIQYLYPWAAGGRYGMWTYTPSGQHWGGGSPVMAGWWNVSVDAELLLHGHGLPSSAPGHSVRLDTFAVL